MRTLWAVLACVGLAGVSRAADAPRLVVAVPPGTAPLTGRLVVAIAPVGRTPEFADAEARNVVVVGQDVTVGPDTPAVVGANAVVFPADDAFSKLPPGRYTARAALLTNRDLLLTDAPGNRYAAPAAVTLAAGQTATLTLDKVHADAPPADTGAHKYLTLDSPKLTAFHGRPMRVRVSVVLPKDFAADMTKTYPLVVHVGGFGERYTSARRITPDPRFVQVHLDGAGPHGDPYQVNSAVNGPYGDALTEEVIPHLEKTYRCGGSGKNRFVAGGSTGGWVSLALQMFYPDTFNGCWAQCPDGVDFRAFQLTDLSRDTGMYTNRWGFDRPAKRTINGDTVYTVRHEVRLERVLGRGGRWELGGQQWASWNAVYGPRAIDGTPVPLWDGDTGAINPGVANQWAKYDLRKVLERDWPTLGPKLAGGKVNIWVGDADDYFLNNAVHHFKAAATALKNPAFDGVIDIAPRRGHTSGWPPAKVLDVMAARAAK